MTTQSLTLNDAIATLRGYQHTVRPHGARYLVAHADEVPRPLSAIEVIDLAGTFLPEITRAVPADTPDTSMPLILLLGALDDHAKALPKPLPIAAVIPLPLTVPSRLEVPIDLVVAGRYQPRTAFDEAELAALAESITAHGIINPPLVVANEHGKLELIAGERRLRAARIAGLRMVPVEIRSYSLQQLAEISGIDNIQRANLAPVEEGRYFNRLIDELAMSEAALARRLGKNRAYIQQRRALASAAPEVLQALDAGAITFSQARAIAQAAPGDDKAQRAAVKKIEERTKQGQRTTEADARSAAEKVVLAKAKKDLEALGWIVTETYSYIVIWAACERPRPWTGVEMTEAVREQRRPQTAPFAPTTPEAIQVYREQLGRHYHLVDTCAPWIGLAKGYNDLPAFYGPDELAVPAAEAQAAFDAMVIRYAAKGWTLGIRGDQFEAVSAKGAREYLYSWSMVEKLIGQIEAGKVSDKKATSDPSRYTCASCKKKTDQYNYIDGETHCDACTKAIKAELAARKQRIASEVARVLRGLLEQASPDALRLLAATFRERPYAESRVKESTGELRAATPNELANLIVRGVTDYAEWYHAAPVYDLTEAKSHRLPPGSTPAIDERESAVAA